MYPKEMKATTWDKYFLDICLTVAKKSKDQSTKVGAVLVDQSNRILSTGFNGAPHGYDDSLIDTREEKLRVTIHSEINSILFAHTNIKGATLYCTHYPCEKCSPVIMQTGITKVVYLASSEDYLSRWENSIALAAKDFAMANIATLMVHQDELIDWDK